MLAKASQNAEAGSSQALEELCRRYWSPLHQFIRSRGYSAAEAEDLTQEFLLHLTRHSVWKRADPQIGRFRSFLLGALGRFLSDQSDRRLALKRGGGALHLSLEEQPEIAQPPQQSELFFDREWALTILENALRALAQEAGEHATAERLQVLQAFLPGSLQTLSYEAAAARLGLSLPALKSELHRFRRRLRDLVRQEIAQTVSAPHEIEAELDHLQQVLLHPGNDFRQALKPSALFA